MPHVPGFETIHAAFPPVGLTEDAGGLLLLGFATGQEEGEAQGNVDGGPHGAGVWAKDGIWSMGVVALHSEYARERGTALGLCTIQHCLVSTRSSNATLAQQNDPGMHHVSGWWVLAY